MGPKSIGSKPGDLEVHVKINTMLAGGKPQRSFIRIQVRTPKSIVQARQLSLIQGNIVINGPGSRFDGKFNFAL